MDTRNRLIRFIGLLCFLNHWISVLADDASIKKCSDVSSWDLAQCKDSNSPSSKLYCISNNLIYEYDSTTVTTCKQYKAGSQERKLFVGTTDYSEYSNQSLTEGVIMYDCNTSGNFECTLVKNQEYFYNGTSKKHYFSCDGDGKCTAIATYHYEGSILYKCVENGACTDITSSIKNGIYLSGASDNKSEYSKIITYYGSTTSLVSSLLNTNAGFYVNAGATNSSDKLKDTLVECSGDTVKCKVKEATDGQVYINKQDGGIIQCTTDNGCIAATGDTNKIYVNAAIDSPTNYDNLIICTNSKACAVGNGALNNIYVNANFDATNGPDKLNQLIKCIGGKCEVMPSGATTSAKEYYFNAYTTENKPLITCSESNSKVTCVAGTANLANGVSEVFYKNAFYGTGKDTDKYLIKCTATTPCELHKNSNAEAGVDEFYVHGDPSNLTNAVIKCSFTGAPVTASCDLISPIENNIYINSFNSKIIACTSSACAAKDGDADVGTTSSSPIYYANAGITSGTTFDNLIIKCMGTCQLINGKPNAVFRNGFVGTDTENYLIICDSATSNATKCSPTTKNTGYYVNGDASNISNSLIQCDNSECFIKNNLVDKFTNGGFTEVFFINQNYVNGNDKEKYAIRCTTQGCDPYKSTNPTIDVLEHYIHGGNTGTDLNGAIIKFSFTATPSNNAKRETTVTATGTSVTPGENTVYINSSTQKLIQCTSNGCAAYNGIGAANEPAYYVNAAPSTVDANNNKRLIRCEENCTEVNGSEYSAYLNANLKTDTNTNEGGAEDMHLILCSNNNCTPTKNEVSNGKYEYYVNAGAYNTNKLVDTLIECSRVNNVECKTKDVSTIVDDTTVKEAFFINKYYDKSNPTNNPYYLIKCTTQNGCVPYKKSDSTDGKNEYYVNGGKTELGDSLIQCKITSNADCSSDVATVVANNIYLNAANNQQVIKCYSDGCKAENSQATKIQSEYYMNSDDSNKQSLIKCGYTDNTLTCTVLSDTDLAISSKNSVYLNANSETDTDHPLIKCTKSSTCDLANSAATSNKPEYYFNADDSNTDPFNGDIIECKDNGTIRICNPINPSLDNIYLNADYGTNNPKQLLVCRAKNDQTPNDVGGCEETKVTFTDNDKLKYYVNSGNVEEEKLKDTLIKCNKSDEKCDIEPNAADKQIYINSHTNQLILCNTNDGCVPGITNASSNNNEFYLNSSDLINESDVLTYDLIKCSVEDNKKVCKPKTATNNQVYVNSYDTEEVIYCLSSEGCKTKKSKAAANKPEFFVNADDIDFDNNSIDTKPLKGDLIKCIYNGSKVNCEAADGNSGDVYINGNYNLEKDDQLKPLGETTNQLIVCKDDGCTATPSTVTNAALPNYYVNAGNAAIDKLSEALIKCSDTSGTVNCVVQSATASQVYLNGNTNLQSTLPLIKCNSNGCKNTASDAKEDSNEYYKNDGDIDETVLQNDIIECVNSGNSGNGISCQLMTNPDEGIYLNSNYAESGDDSQLIQCSKGNGCQRRKSQAVAKNIEYYLNAEATDLTNALIFCTNNKCEKQTPEDIPAYYVGVGDNDEVNGLIECLESDDNGGSSGGTSGSGGSGGNSSGSSGSNGGGSNGGGNNGGSGDNNGGAGNNGNNGGTGDNNGGTGNNGNNGGSGGNNGGTGNNGGSGSNNRKRSLVKKCTLKSAFTSDGYYLNAGNNKANEQVILCDGSTGCQSLSVDLGYYVNAGDTTKPIIKCDREGFECTAESKECPKADAVTAGDYCYEDGQLKFYPANESSAVSASKSDDYYTFATIPMNRFPGIITETSSLFKISYYYINRFYQSGVIMIDKSGKLVNSLTNNQIDITLYECDDSTKLCTERAACTANTYMYDTENQKAVFCNDGKLIYADFTGYVVDGNRVSGSSHPYLIKCEAGSKCSSLKPKNLTYFINSGYDALTNNLIQCNNNNCITIPAEAGYFVAEGGSGVIYCSSANTCVYNQIKSEVKFVNAGIDKTSYAIISCNRISGCGSAKANEGYYMTYTSTRLIHCTSSSTCAEFVPTVNYYNNADSTDSTSTIIHCIQNNQVVTCNAEATNTGFYISSTPDILIRCRIGSKCKTVRVKNGIFRGALKNTKKGAKRADEDTEVLEGDGKSVVLPRDTDDAFGIIRCVAGKCSLLSPSEVAAIPICEFNNNKCYITTDYAMTKSATTSISAGNVCTNGDRSVFYFATDVVVVKPNVISGVISTYVFTTTNSNCLEVNESYNDLYFTVGSNIYLLDQGSVFQFYDPGYYFINTAKNTLVSGNDINTYNDENVKLFRCTGNSCNIVDKPNTTAYYADVNKRILRYNINSESYSFAYEKDITCIFANNKCTPNADLKNQEFCITYKGEIALATSDIKNRETGECYKATSITSDIYGYSQHLYTMNLYSAQMVDQTGYYIISLSTNNTVIAKNYKNKNNSLVIYGCQLSSCKVYEPDESTYYYDAQAKTILRYKDGIWNTPTTSGYAYISIDPSTSYIYRFTKTVDEIKITAMANYGYYYTVDGEMYHCDHDEDGKCTQIQNSGYYFTNTGEVYYCIHDSEGIEPTECTKQACISGQYYYIDDAYYRCESSSVLAPVMSRYCSYNDNVIINFPLALTEEYPDKIKQAVEGIEKNNNSTAIVSYRGKNYLESVSGIFTNCTYNAEEIKSTFDLVCVNNYVTMDEESKSAKICSIEQLGYVECIDDGENPEKCKVSAAFFLRPSFWTMLVMTLTLLYLFGHDW